jgi:GT2 family glycosyltransferase
VWNEEHDLARVEPQERVGQRPGDPAEAAVGVEERGARVESDSHRLYDATVEQRFSVVIPTRMGGQNLDRTLPPLREALGGDDEVVIVADHCERPMPALPDSRWRVVAHRGSPGFAPACNRGAREARGRLLLILNDDVVVAPGVLDRLEEELGRPGVAASGPNVISEALGRSESGTSVRLLHGVLECRQGALNGSGAVSVPYVCGAALAVRRTDFLRVGGFDERLAPYFWEDLDLCLRLHDEVGDTTVVSELTVWHRHGATINQGPEQDRRIVYERNRLLVTWRHITGWRWLSHVAWLPLRLLAGVVRDRAVPLGFLNAMARLTSQRDHVARRD